jgi:hypothetical protein
MEPEKMIGAGSGRKLEFKNYRKSSSKISSFPAALVAITVVPGSGLKWSSGETASIYARGHSNPIMIFKLARLLQCQGYGYWTPKLFCGMQIIPCACAPKQHLYERKTLKAM